MNSAKFAHYHQFHSFFPYPSFLANNGYYTEINCNNVRSGISDDLFEMYCTNFSRGTLYRIKITRRRTHRYTQTGTPT